MPEFANVSLAEHTTMRVGGPARRFLVAETNEELLDAVRAADADGTQVLVLSGGSNVVASDEGFDGLVIKMATRGVHVENSGHSGVVVTAAAGERWDDFVHLACRRGWSGIEAMSGIPGLVGSTPVQNVGAYGAEVAQVIAGVRCWDRQRGQVTNLPADSCGFAYRDSVFKQNAGRYVVLDVTFQLDDSEVSAPVRYAELAAELGVELESRAPLTLVRDAVLAVRRRKAMVLDEADHDTWSCGSFFTNPILSPEQAANLPPEAPQFGQADGHVKTSAAWLIQHAGFDKGYGHGAITLSTRHVLAITNRGGGTSREVRELADEVVAGVQRRWGIVLDPEPTFL